MSKNLFRKLFRRRQRLIQAADAAAAEAERISSLAGSGPKQQRAAAATKCERAAALYLKAGLGLLAKQQFAAASLHCCALRDQERARLNQERWSAVPVYWEDDETA
ncbi:MAG: hypothetical protein ACKOHG_20865 [Planctomycetia bacterium]